MVRNGVAIAPLVKEGKSNRDCFPEVDMRRETRDVNIKTARRKTSCKMAMPFTAT